MDTWIRIRLLDSFGQFVGQIGIDSVHHRRAIERDPTNPTIALIDYLWHSWLSVVSGQTTGLVAIGSEASARSGRSERPHMKRSDIVIVVGKLSSGNLSSLQYIT